MEKPETLQQCFKNLAKLGAQKHAEYSSEYMHDIFLKEDLQKFKDAIDGMEECVKDNDKRIERLEQIRNEKVREYNNAILYYKMMLDKCLQETIGRDYGRHSDLERERKREKVRYVEFHKWIA